MGSDVVVEFDAQLSLGIAQHVVYREYAVGSVEQV